MLRAKPKGNLYMLKIARYAKPYIALLIAGIAVVFVQALASLELPNIMSDIVNVGIQMSGITDKAPRAISAEGRDLAMHFSTIEGGNLIADSYEKLSGQDLAKMQEIYPDANENTFFLKADLSEGQNAQLESVFGRAMYAVTLALGEMQQAQGAPAGDSGQDSDAAMAFDMQTIGQALTMMPYSYVEQAVSTALNADDSLTQNVAGMYIIGFYDALGYDIEAHRSNYMFSTGLYMLFICFVVAAAAISGGYFIAKFGAGVARDLRRDAFVKVTSFTSGDMDKFSTASLITRTTNDVTQVQLFLSMGLRLLFLAPLTGIGGVVMALNKSLSMTWIIALAVLLMMCFIGVLFVVALPKFKNMQNLVDKLNLVSRESLSGMMVIRAFSTQDFEEKRFEKANRTLADNTLFVNRAMASMMPIIMFIMNGIMLLVIWVGSEQISNSTMQVGDMMAYMQYAMQVVMSFFFISMMFVMLPRASVSAERVNEVITTQNAIKDPIKPVGGNVHYTGKIVFDNVSFRYPGAEENVLENISFTAHPGETTAFIGSTGSGKSTLVNLIPRFYDISAGKVTIDGVDVRDVMQRDLRDNIGYVPQKGMLFSGDINYNLRYGAKDAPQEDIAKAADVAQATEFIEKLDDKFETEISQGGSNVSGGQRQRLSIARALAKKAPVYIFDDTFSALDFKTDAKLRKALKSYTQNATVLIVAQRVSTIMGADKIVVLDEGKIAGIGTHLELLASCNTYREIAESQLSKEELA